jgi:cell division transport system ATP-binding protein
MIQLQSVSKSYFGEEQVLHQISLEVKKGEFLYVLGGSGAGKSSLLRMLATEEAPSEGQLSLFGYDLAQMTPAALRTVRQSIGYIPQEVRLVPDLSVLDNVMLSLVSAGRRVSVADSRLRVHDLLERMGLSAFRHKRAALLSGGEAQRVAVVRALARSPDLIIADEPTGAQDQDFTWSMMELFFRANAGAHGATVIVATHDREIVRRVRKRCAILKGGQLGFDTWQPDPNLTGGAPCFY